MGRRFVHSAGPFFATRCFVSGLIIHLTGAQCRAQADECRRLALAADQTRRTVFFDLAHTWETLAEHADRLERVTTEPQSLPNAASSQLPPLPN
jgi:hypothetical protein